MERGGFFVGVLRFVLVFEFGFGLGFDVVFEFGFGFLMLLFGFLAWV